MTLKAAPTFRGQTTWELELGRVQTESKSKLVNRNENKQGADWCLVQKRSPSFLVSEKINDLQPNAKIKKVVKKLGAENRQANRKHEQQQFIQRVVLVSAPTSECHIRTAVHSTQPRASTATQPLRCTVNSQQANHTNSPDVLGPLFPGVRAKAKIIGNCFSTTPARTRLHFSFHVLILFGHLV